MSGVGRRIAEPVTEILVSIAEHVPRGLGAGHRRIGDRTRQAADAFDDAERRIEDSVPIYMVDNEGNVQRLTPEGDFVPVGGDDRSGVRGLLGADGRATPKRSGHHNLATGVPSRERPRVDSRPVVAGTTELARATQRARLAANDRGGNYAAFRYQDGDSHFILVGRSGPQQSLHSEQNAGVPFIGAMERLAGAPQEIYTERAPCTTRRCDAWLAQYFEGADVTHTFEYGETKESRRKGNDAHAEYMARLFRDDPEDP
ncbi:nucleic acid/nucleotide deaminase domain-containing protein [Streptomyces avicenniae]|uniref:nucleic acid/nucleotide deaminase domain-containing protein n=1 Tax=Streptomyces avicenniae TaxID=500153 RepID=UPI0006995CFD|nr:nucleic acid/nucleotide deaminase domain-containing protein [Streptomyces avicenniae]